MSAPMIGCWSPAPGPVGLLLVAVLRAQGIADITVSEPSPVRRQQALAVGATRVVTPDALEEPPMAQPVAEPYAVVFECSGHASAAEAGFGQLDYAGTLVIVGTGFEPPRINQNRMIIFELQIIGAYNYNDEGFQPAVDLLDSGTLAVRGLDRARGHSAQRSDGLHGAARPGRDPEQGHGPTGSVDMSPAAFAPRINHVAISVDAALMDDEGRAALLDFFSEVFGWTEGDNSTEKGNPLILYTGALGQFVYLLPAKDEFMVTPNMDHFGMEVSSMEEMVEILERVKAYQGKDDRVRVTEVGAMVTRYNDKRVHAHQRLHLVPAAAVDRAPARRATFPVLNGSSHARQVIGRSQLAIVIWDARAEARCCRGVRCNALQRVRHVGHRRGVQLNEVAHRGSTPRVPTTVWLRDPPVRANWTLAIPPASLAAASKRDMPLRVDPLDVGMITDVVGGDAVASPPEQCRAPLNFSQCSVVASTDLPRPILSAVRNLHLRSSK